MTRLALLLAAAGAASCAGASGGPIFPTSTRFPELARRPPSFAAEATPLPPLTSLEGPEQASPIRREQVPLDSETAPELVSRFFIAVLRESTRDLLPLLSSNAAMLSEGNRQPAQAIWRTRFAQLDYTSLSGRLVAAPQTLRTYTFASAARAKQDGVPSPASPSEVVVVARPGGAWVGKTRLFGEALAFRLRPRAEAQTFEITEIVEDFRLP